MQKLYNPTIKDKEKEMLRLKRLVDSKGSLDYKLSNNNPMVKNKLRNLFVVSVEQFNFLNRGGVYLTFKADSIKKVSYIIITTDAIYKYLSNENKYLLLHKNVSYETLYDTLVTNGGLNKNVASIINNWIVSSFDTRRKPFE